MLDMNEINEEIAKLENSKCTTYDVCNKLAVLYIVRQHYGADHSSTTTQKKMEMTPMMPMKE